MQLGTRWSWGTEPPARLPEAVVTAIREVESSTAGSPEQRWTLTWLEGQPIVELDPAEGDNTVMVIRYRVSDDTASMISSNSDEEWVEE